MPLILPATTPLYEPFRARDAVVYVDECGQFNPRGKEINALGGIMVPATVADRLALAEVVEALAHRVAERHPSARWPKGSHLHAADYEWLAAELMRRPDWLALDRPIVIGSASSEYTGEFFAEVVDLMEGFVEALPRADQLDLRIHAALRAARRLQQRQPAYATAFVLMLEHLAKWFRARDIRPQGEVILDASPKIPPQGLAGLQLVTRWMIGTTFGEVFRDRFVELYGTRPEAEVRVRLADDRGHPGIVLAGIIAFACVMDHQGKDPTGAYGRFRRALAGR